MPEQHAILSASGAYRWLKCTPSAMLELQEPDSQSPYAAEGTKAHELAEKKLNSWIKTGRRTAFKCEDKEMDEATSGYRDYVIEVFNVVKEKTSDALLLVEQRLDFSKWVPEGFGTGDAVIIGDGGLHVIDLKYGKGVQVNAEGNPQLKLYAAGAMAEFDVLYDIQHITVHIYQPRLDHVSTITYQVDELTNWLNQEVKPKATLAIEGKGDFNPSVEDKGHCLFCKYKKKCLARANACISAIEQAYPSDSGELSTEQIAKLLPVLGGVSAWIKDLEEYALERALEGVHFDGYKVVEGTSRRKIMDEPGLTDKLRQLGYKDDLILTKPKLETISNLEKAIGKKVFAGVALGFIDKPKGKPTLVPVSDKRPEWVEGSLNDFADEFDKKEVQ